MGAERSTPSISRDFDISAALNCISPILCAPPSPQVAADMDSDDDDALFAAALESFEQAAARQAPQRALDDPVEPPKAQALQPLRVSNAGGSGGAAVVAVPPACAPPRQPAAAAPPASGVRHLFYTGRKQSPLPAVNGAAGGSCVAGAADLPVQQAPQPQPMQQQQQQQRQQLPAEAATGATAAAFEPQQNPGPVPRADGALIEPALQQQQQQPAPAAAEPAADAATAAAAPQPQPRRKLRQLFDFLVVYDLEATCERDKTKQLTPQASKGCQPRARSAPTGRAACHATPVAPACNLPLCRGACSNYSTALCGARPPPACSCVPLPSDLPLPASPSPTAALHASSPACLPLAGDHRAVLCGCGHLQPAAAGPRLPTICAPRPAPTAD